jgi:hypothetical protein
MFQLVLKAFLPRKSGTPHDRKAHCWQADQTESYGKQHTNDGRKQQLSSCPVSQGMV